MKMQISVGSNSITITLDTGKQYNIANKTDRDKLKDNVRHIPANRSSRLIELRGTIASHRHLSAVDEIYAVVQKQLVKFGQVEEKKIVDVKLTATHNPPLRLPIIGTAATLQHPAFIAQSQEIAPVATQSEHISDPILRLPTLNNILAPQKKEEVKMLTTTQEIQLPAITVKREVLAIQVDLLKATPLVTAMSAMTTTTPMTAGAVVSNPLETTAVKGETKVDKLALAVLPTALPPTATPHAYGTYAATDIGSMMAMSTMTAITTTATALPVTPMRKGEEKIDELKTDRVMLVAEQKDAAAPQQQENQQTDLVLLKVKKEILEVKDLKGQPGQYLLLDPIPTGSQYVIGSPALLSSGDIYHILAYLILARFLNYALPLVIIGYDTPDTKLQAERSRGLANLLGFSNVVCKELKTSGYQPRTRLNNLRKYVSTLSTPSYLIDQKITTLLLARFVQFYGYAATSTILRSGFCEVDAKEARLHQKSLQEIDGWVKTKVTEMEEKIDAEVKAAVAEAKKTKGDEKKASEKKVLIFNCRTAAGSNNDQDIGPQALATIEKIITERKIIPWWFVAGGSSARAPETDKYTFLFAKSINDTTQYKWDQYGLYKYRQIKLFQRCSLLPGLIGVAGNTSGTLDQPAFMGFSTYCFHLFSATRGNLYLDAQDYRVTIQNSFMSIGGRLDSNEKEYIQDFSSWLDSGGQKMVMSKVSGMVVGINGRNQGGTKYVLHDDRMPFAAAITWQKSKDTRDLREHIKIGNNCGGYAVQFSFFKEQDERIRTKWDGKKEEKVAPSTRATALQPLLNLTQGHLASQSLPATTLLNQFSLLSLAATTNVNVTTNENAEKKETLVVGKT
jgi:hypothetical protein